MLRMVEREHRIDGGYGLPKTLARCSLFGLSAVVLVNALGVPQGVRHVQQGRGLQRPRRGHDVAQAASASAALRERRQVSVDAWVERE
jgi:hypothetical protein